VTLAEHLHRPEVARADLDGLFERPQADVLLPAPDLQARRRVNAAERSTAEARLSGMASTCSTSFCARSFTPLCRSMAASDTATEGVPGAFWYKASRMGRALAMSPRRTAASPARRAAGSSSGASVRALSKALKDASRSFFRRQA
jgi:hypothetical protein